MATKTQKSSAIQKEQKSSYKQQDYSIQQMLDVAMANSRILKSIRIKELIEKKLKKMQVRLKFHAKKNKEKRLKAMA